MPKKCVRDIVLVYFVMFDIALVSHSHTYCFYYTLFPYDFPPAIRRLLMVRSFVCISERVWVKRHARLDGNGRHIRISYSYNPITIDVCLNNNIATINDGIAQNMLMFIGSFTRLRLPFHQAQALRIRKNIQLQMSLIWLQRFDNELSNFLTSDVVSHFDVAAIVWKIKWAIDWINIDNLLNQRESDNFHTIWNDSNVNCNFHELMRIFVLFAIQFLCFMQHKWMELHNINPMESDEEAMTKGIFGHELTVKNDSNKNYLKKIVRLFRVPHSIKLVCAFDAWQSFRWGCKILDFMVNSNWIDFKSKEKVVFNIQFYQIRKENFV